MAAKRGRKPRTPTTDIYALTGLTHTDLLILELDLKALRTTELKGLGTHYRMPAGMFEKLRQLVKKLQRPWTLEQIKRCRWDAVRSLLDSPYWGRGYEEACQLASTSLRNTPAAAGPRMMSRDYRAVEKALPKGERRARTYRKRLTAAERECRGARGPEERLAALKMSIQEVEALKMSIQEVAEDSPGHFEKSLVKCLKVETLGDLTGARFHDAVSRIEARRNYLRRQKAEQKAVN